MPPCTYLGDELGSNQAFGNKQLKDVGFKQLSQDIFLKEGNGHKGTIGTKNSGGNQGMDMGIPIEKISRCSNREDAAKKNSFLQFGHRTRAKPFLRIPQSRYFSTTRAVTGRQAPQCFSKRRSYSPTKRSK